MTPRDETLAALVRRLSDDLFELWEERAAVLEFDAGLARDLAEARAFLQVLRSHPKAVLEALLP